MSAQRAMPSFDRVRVSLADDDLIEYAPFNDVAGSIDGSVFAPLERC